MERHNWGALGHSGFSQGGTFESLVDLLCYRVSVVRKSIIILVRKGADPLVEVGEPIDPAVLAMDSHCSYAG